MAIAPKPQEERNLTKSLKEVGKYVYGKAEKLVIRLAKPRTAVKPGTPSVSTLGPKISKPLTTSPSAKGIKKLKNTLDHTLRTPESVAVPGAKNASEKVKVWMQQEAETKFYDAQDKILAENKIQEWATWQYILAKTKDIKETREAIAKRAEQALNVAREFVENSPMIPVVSMGELDAFMLKQRVWKKHLGNLVAQLKKSPKGLRDIFYAAFLPQNLLATTGYTLIGIAAALLARKLYYAYQEEEDVPLTSRELAIIFACSWFALLGLRCTPDLLSLAVYNLSLSGQVAKIVFAHEWYNDLSCSLKDRTFSDRPII